MIYVIVPFSRPQFKQNVIDNFLRQNYQDKKLIIVENGDGINSFKNYPYIVLSSEKHHSFAKNEAIHWIKKNGGGLVVTMDDDDIYLSNYLNEISYNINKAQVVGKDSRFIKSENDELFLIYNKENYYTSGVLGSTIAVMAEDAVEFIEAVDDDYLFCEEIINKGGKVFATSIYNFIQCKYNHGHMWNIKAENIIQNALHVGYKAIKINKDYNIVSGVNKQFEFKMIEKREVGLDEEFIYQKNKHQNTPIEELLKRHNPAF